MREGTLLLGSSTVGPPDYIASGPIGTGGLTLDSGSELAAAISGVTFANSINLTGNAQIGAGSSDNNALNITGQISGSAVVTYFGGPTGSLTLSGSNSYTGNTVIEGGTLYANNSSAFGVGSNTVVLSGGGLSVSSGITISNPISTSGTGSVISGSGTIATPVTIDGTVSLAPGDPLGSQIGNLTFSQGLTLTTNGSINFHLYDANGTAGTGFSLFSVAYPGVLSLTANPNSLSFNINTVNISGTPAPAINFNAANSYSWMFATSANGIAGFSASQFNINTAGFSNAIGGGTFSVSEVGNDLFLNFTPVPEPSTWALLGLGVLTAVPYALRRRRRRA
jgi:autotransporter-associated beta strand protein